MAEPAIQVRALTRRFGDFTAVDGVSFDVEKGAIFGFLGANGAGKSTIIRMLCGLLRPSSGELRVAGVDVARDPEAVKRRIGYMSQRFSLYGELTVDDNVRLFGALYGLSGARLKLRRAWALETVQLGDAMDRRVSELSGGVRQRVALACALLHEPELVFLDEPTGGVDPLMRRAFYELVDALSASGVTVFLTTHFLDEAEYCHRIALIGAGKLLAEGSPSELKARFQDRVLLDLRTGAPGPALAAVANVPEVAEASAFGAGVHVLLRPGVDETRARETLSQALLAAHVEAAAPERVPPTLEDVFLQVVQGGAR